MKNWLLVTAAPLNQRSNGARKTTTQQTNSMSEARSEKWTFFGQTPVLALSFSCLDTIDSHASHIFRKIVDRHFRFSVVGSLLAAPPAWGELKRAIQSLAEKTWTHPVSGSEARFATRTIERWYYAARREQDDPVGVLRRAIRKDCGNVSLVEESSIEDLPARRQSPTLVEQLFKQYGDYPHWTYQLHYDNLVARVKADPSLGPLRSYSTVKRYMKAHRLIRKRRPTPKGRPGEPRVEERRQSREIRSYEAEYVGSLWHLDFHHGSLKVLTYGDQWQRPIVLGIFDDHSRLCCHLQWYLTDPLCQYG